MLVSWLEYHGIVPPEAVLVNTDRGDGVLGLFPCENPTGTPTPEPVPTTWLNYYDAVGADKIPIGINRGDGVLGSLICNPDPTADCLIETVIQNVIANEHALTSRLPLDRWITGTTRLEGPYCSINVEGGSPDIRTNTGRIDAETVRFQWYYDDHHAGRTIQETFINVIDDLSYNFQNPDGSKSVLCARVQNKIAIQEPTLVWQFLTDVIFRSE